MLLQQRLTTTHKLTLQLRLNKQQLTVRLHKTLLLLSLHNTKLNKLQAKLLNQLSNKLLLNQAALLKL
jgi:hypothetical protein